MLDHVLDNIISRLMAGAGLIMAAAIAAVTSAMALYAFCAPHMGPAWAYVVVAGVAGLVVAVWSLVQRQTRERNRQPPLDERIVEALRAHPTAAFLAGMAAGALVKGRPGEAKALWKARSAKKGEHRG